VRSRETLYVTNAHFAPDGNFVALLADVVPCGVDVRLRLSGPRTDAPPYRKARYTTWRMTCL
jgi:hypothetical protein